MNISDNSNYRAARAFDDHAEVYDAWFDDSLVYTIELAALTSLPTPMNEPGLEVGVGPGRFAEKLGVAYGVDPARAPLMLAAERHIRCCQGLGGQLPIKDKMIGTVYLLFTLCFVADPRKTIMECARILRDEGILVVGMIPVGGKWGEDLAAKKNEGHPIYRYARFYSIENVKNWLDRAGFAVVEYRSTLYQPPGCVERHESPRIVLDEKAGFAVIVAEKKHG